MAEKPSSMDSRLRASFAHQSEAVGRWVYAVVIAGLTALVGFVAAAFDWVPLAPWFFLAVALAVIVAAQFAAYHYLRAEMVEERTQAERDRREREEAVTTHLRAFLNEGIDLKQQLGTSHSVRVAVGVAAVKNNPEWDKVHDLHDRAFEMLRERGSPELIGDLGMGIKAAEDEAERWVLEKYGEPVAEDGVVTMGVREFADRQPHPLVTLNGLLNGLKTAIERSRD